MIIDCYSIEAKGTRGNREIEKRAIEGKRLGWKLKESDTLLSTASALAQLLLKIKRCKRNLAALLQLDENVTSTLNENLLINCLNSALLKRHFCDQNFPLFENGLKLRAISIFSNC